MTENYVDIPEPLKGFDLINTDILLPEIQTK